MLTTWGGANRREHDFLRILLVWDDRRYPNFYTSSGFDLNLYFFTRYVYFSSVYCVVCVVVVVRGLAFPAISPESYAVWSLERFIRRRCLSAASRRHAALGSSEMSTDERAVVCFFQPQVQWLLYEICPRKVSEPGQPLESGHENSKISLSACETGFYWAFLGFDHMIRRMLKRLAFSRPMGGCPSRHPQLLPPPPQITQHTRATAGPVRLL